MSTELCAELRRLDAAVQAGADYGFQQSIWSDVLNAMSQQGDRIAALEAEVDRLRGLEQRCGPIGNGLYSAFHELDKARDMLRAEQQSHHRSFEMFKAAEARANALEAENAKLRELFFSGACYLTAEHMPPDDVPDDTEWTVSVLVRDIRRARAALSRGEG